MLQTKKRYVGYMYETLDQKEPVFDAKGIETVRRDACPAVAKVLKFTSLSFLHCHVNQVGRMYPSWSSNVYLWKSKAANIYKKAPK